MIPFNEQLRDEFIKRGLRHARVESHAASEALAVLRNLANEITKTIGVLDTGNPTQKLKRLTALQKSIAETVAAHYDELDARTAENGTAIAAAEVEWLGSVFNTNIGAQFANVTLTKELLRSITDNTMIEGAATSAWFEKQASDFNFTFVKQMRQGIGQGEALNDLVRRIRGTRESGYRLAPDGSPAIMPGASRNAETLVRTAALTVANDTRAAVYAQNADIIKQLQWHATLDPKTCLKCAPRDGQVWEFPESKPVDSAPPFSATPLHFRCRCLLVPVTYSWAELAKRAGGDVDLAKKLDQIPPGTRASIDGQVPSAMTYNDWLTEKQKTAPQMVKEILGETRAELFGAGRVKAIDLIDDNGRPLRIAELNGATAGIVQPRPAAAPRVIPEVSNAPERLSFGTPAPKPAPVQAPAPVTPEPAPKPAKVAEPVDWQLLPDSQKGSNLGGIYSAGKKQYYVKFYSDMTQAESEIIAQKVNAAMGLKAPKLKIVELVAPDGALKRGLASEWLNDIKPLTKEQMIAHPDIAKAYQAAVITKNWDILGTGFDNLMLTKKGELICIDAGGAFNFRAQGGLKPFGADLSELVTLRNSSYDSGKVFDAVFSNNVFAEKEAWNGIDIADLTKVFRGNNLPPDMAKELKKAYIGRLEALIERYDLDGVRTYQGFGKHLDEFKKWGGSFAADRAATETGAWSSYNLKSEMGMLVSLFEEYASKNILKDGATKQLKTMLGCNYGWSGNSSNGGGAVMKEWATNYFGGTDANLYQHGTSGAKAKIILNAQQFRDYQGVSKDVMDELLKAEYEFQQYYLTRLNGYDSFRVERGMSRKEFADNFTKSRGVNYYQNGGMYSATNQRRWTSTDRRVSIEVRNEDIFKTWYQGKDYMHYGSSESEFVTIGRKLRATEMKKSGDDWVQ